MNTVITEADARKIAGAREPQVPIEYEQLHKALDACCTLDETKILGDKADVLIAWARMYHDKSRERKYKIFKLHAYRRMGELARELRPRKVEALVASRSRSGKTPLLGGPRTALRGIGLSCGDANAAIVLSHLSAEQMQALEQRRKVPAPTTVRPLLRDSSPCPRVAYAMVQFAAYCRGVSPLEFKRWAATQKRRKEREANMQEAREWVTILLKNAQDIDEWLAELK